MGVFVLPMPFLIDGATYFEDINLTQEEFYKKLEHDADISTSQPSPESVMQIWDKALEEYDQVVHIPMSSGLSGSCQTAMMLADEFDGRVLVVDNQRISVTQRQSVLDALEMAEKGMGAKEIVDVLMKEKLEILLNSSRRADVLQLRVRQLLQSSESSLYFRSRAKSWIHLQKYVG